MKPYKIKQAAELFDISLQSAFKMRINYLLSQIAAWPDYFDNDGLIPELSEREALEQIHDIALFKSRMNKPVPAGRITDEMIQRASDFPIDQLFDFGRSSRIPCPFHNSKAPDLSLYKKTNSVRCFGACGKSWGPINAIMDRDGLNFIYAVKELNK